MTVLSPKDLVVQIYNADVGCQPTNKSVKPVHIANGFARTLTERSYETSALARMLRRWVKNQRLNVLEERNPHSDIIAAYGEAFETATGAALDLAALADLRTLALGSYGADDAAFEDPDKSSYTLSNERFVSKDPSDGRAGLFLTRLLKAGNPGRAATQIVSLLQSSTDPWTVLAEPMLALARPRQEQPSPEVARAVSLSDSLFSTDAGGELESAVRLRLRRSFDRLAHFEEAEHSKLSSLRRLVLFGCFTIHVHLLSRWSEVSPGSPRPPILLDLFNGTHPAIRDASRATVRAAGDAVEGLLHDRISEYVREVSKRPQGPQALLADDVVRTRYEAYRSGRPFDLEAMVETYLDLGLEAVKCHPIEYLTELGRRAGFMTPWAVQGRGGKLQKRYGLNLEFLEVLVAATVVPDQPLEFNEFLDRLRDDFGIVAGRPSDDELIRRNNLNEAQFGTPISIREEELRMNVAAFRRAVEEIGYAKTYADGRTLVTTRLEVAA